MTNIVQRLCRYDQRGFWPPSMTCTSSYHIWLAKLSISGFLIPTKTTKTEVKSPGHDCVPSVFLSVPSVPSDSQTRIPRWHRCCNVVGHSLQWYLEVHPSRLRHHNGWYLGAGASPFRALKHHLGPKSDVWCFTKMGKPKHHFKWSLFPENGQKYQVKILISSQQTLGWIKARVKEGKYPKYQINRNLDCYSPPNMSAILGYQGDPFPFETRLAYPFEQTFN